MGITFKLLFTHIIGIIPKPTFGASYDRPGNLCLSIMENSSLLEALWEAPPNSFLNASSVAPLTQFLMHYGNHSKPPLEALWELPSTHLLESSPI